MLAPAARRARSGARESDAARGGARRRRDRRRVGARRALRLAALRPMRGSARFCSRHRSAVVRDARRRLVSGARFGRLLHAARARRARREAPRLARRPLRSVRVRIALFDDRASFRSTHICLRRHRRTPSAASNAARLAGLRGRAAGVAVLWLLYNFVALGNVERHRLHDLVSPGCKPVFRPARRFGSSICHSSCGRSSCRCRRACPSFPWLRPDFRASRLLGRRRRCCSRSSRAAVRWVVALWVAALLTAVPNFLYYVNGYAQFGMRHALDFEPFLVALMMLAVRDAFPSGATC